MVDLESFFPSKDRFALAMQLNQLLAAPGFSAWLEGEALDIDRLLYTENGRPRVSVISIAHLDDQERMFFVSLLLNEIVGWMRDQRGTSSLRAVIYFDEIFGFLPPVANPPSKAPLLTLLKQARAFGLGLVVATQNPFDPDYKALSNAGTWMLGRLQTERDKARVLDGLEGAAAGIGSRARFNPIWTACYQRSESVNSCCITCMKRNRSFSKHAGRSPIFAVLSDATSSGSSLCLRCLMRLRCLECQAPPAPQAP